MAKVLVVAIGSAGDIHPNIGLALTLKKRGHDVHVIANSYFNELIKNSHLNYIKLGTAEEYIKINENPDIWNPHKGFTIIADMLINLMRPLYGIIADHYIPDETVITGSNFAFGARIAQEKLGIPMASIYISPAAIRSINDQIPLMMLPRSSAYLSPLIKKMIFSLIDRMVIDKTLCSGLNSFRQELNLPPVSNIFGEWIHSPELVIGLYPEWFGALSVDWPQNSYLTNFPLFDPPVLDKSIKEVEDFIESGTNPIIFAAPSIKKDMRYFFEVSIKICRVLGERGILISRFPESAPLNLPDTIRCFTYAPFDKILPRAKALVHCGSLGNAAQALVAGIPQLVTPSAFDHPEIGFRLERLGVGSTLSPNKYKIDLVIEKLKYLIHSPEMAENCRLISERVKKTNGLSEACELIERLAINQSGGKNE